MGGHVGGISVTATDSPVNNRRKPEMSFDCMFRATKSVKMLIHRGNAGVCDPDFCLMRRPCSISVHEFRTVFTVKLFVNRVSPHSLRASSRSYLPLHAAYLRSMDSLNLRQSSTCALTAERLTAGHTCASFGAETPGQVPVAVLDPPGPALAAGFPSGGARLPDPASAAARRRAVPFLAAPRPLWEL